MSDAVARALITAGGIGTIAAVLLVCVFLLWVAFPLFLSAKTETAAEFPVPWAADKAARPLKLGIDEYQSMAWTLLADGTLVGLRADNGHQLLRQPLVADGPALSAASFAVGSDAEVALGFADGSVRLGRIGCSTSFPTDDDLPPEFQGLEPGSMANYQDGVIQRTPEGQLRWQQLIATFDEPIPAKGESPVVLIDQIAGEGGYTYCVLTADGKLRINEAKQKTNLLTDEVTWRVKGGELPVEVSVQDPPAWMLLSGLGDNVFLAWPDGRLLRFDTRSIKAPQLAEELDLVPEEGVRLTSLAMLLGRSTLLAGDSTGRVRAWFRTRPADAATPDHVRLTMAHELPATGSPVTCLASSQRTRVAAAGHQDGSLRLFQVTSNQVLATLPGGEAGPVAAVAMSPKNDGVLRATAHGIAHWRVDLKHPEVTLATLFRPVWYEGYEHPEHVWQSTGGTVDEEPKLGLVPLIFGTLKATFYSLLFGVPLALLAAIYTSEFLHPKVKRKIKPTIELMASLPSVVLGFLAALFIAPLVARHVPAVLTSFVTVPVALLAGAYLWQLLPHRLAIKLARRRFLFILAALPAGLAAAGLLGPLVERWLFAGNIMAWLDGQAGSATGAWLILLLPLCGVGTFVLGREANSWLRRASADWSRGKLAVVDLAKFLAGLALAVGGALVLSLLLASAPLRLDPRGTFVDTYDQRNALVVGFVMGFAIIPIIYTIADDALSSVPEHLRSASLGAGATPWQTATRIVIPTAMSGLFSAVMIGLGRAVGETMIVLMAAGNTPVLKMNIFNGFRTLSANLAVELPEAVKDSTHYRTLFLAALVLFAITFAVNTLAEVIRLRFRRRAYEL